MDKIQTINYLIRVINMKRLRDKNNHRYNQEKKDLEVVKTLQEIKKEVVENGKIN